MQTGLGFAMPGFQYDIRGAMEFDQSPTKAAVPAFRFERRRGRLDWRVLHGIDVGSIVSGALPGPPARGAGHGC